MSGAGRRQSSGGNAGKLGGTRGRDGGGNRDDRSRSGGRSGGGFGGSGGNRDNRNSGGRGTSAGRDGGIAGGRAQSADRRGSSVGRASGNTDVRGPSAGTAGRRREEDSQPQPHGRLRATEEAFRRVGHAADNPPAFPGTAAAKPGRGARAAKDDAAAPVKREQLLKLGKIKGEWMELRLPDHLINVPPAQLAKYLPLPPKHISKLLQSRGLQLQGPNLRLHLFPRENRDYPSDWMELNILYEDDFTLVVNKPAGIEVHPSEKGQRKTLAHAVAAYYEMSGQDVRIRHIHRIDKDTTGPVLYAKNEFAHYQYDKDMREKNIERIYVALAEGGIEGNKGKVDLPIGQDRHHPTRRRVSETGDPAVTHFEVAERFRDHTLVRLRLETGRTHQIRVHMSAINHPLAGDGLYGGKRGVISRQALHGERLIWRHPWTGDKQSASAPLPDDFAAALVRLRNGGGRSSKSE